MQVLIQTDRLDAKTGKLYIYRDNELYATLSAPHEDWGRFLVGAWPMKATLELQDAGKDV